jgi:hypothetical protein
VSAARLIKVALDHCARNFVPGVAFNVTAEPAAIACDAVPIARMFICAPVGNE